MSVLSAKSLAQLNQDLLYELTLTSQLLFQMRSELEQIKELTSPGGKLESNVKENANIMDTLSRLVLTDINLDNIPLVRTMDMDTSINGNQRELQHPIKDITNLNNIQ